MLSKRSQDLSAKQTRLQEATQKRRLEEERTQSDESKRQKEMLTSSGVIGPRDIIPNSNIKLEEISESSLIPKQESLQNESSAEDAQQLPNFVNPNIQKIKLDESDIVVKVEGSLVVEESSFPEQLDDNYQSIEHNQVIFTETGVQCNETSSPIEANGVESHDAAKPGNDIKAKKPLNSPNPLVDQKPIEMGSLENFIRVLEHRLMNAITATSGKLSSDEKSEEDEFGDDETFEFLPISKDVQFLHSQILKLQVKILSQLAGRNLTQMLIPMYPELQLNNTLCGRATHNSWQTAMKAFAGEMGHVATWGGHPFKKLIWPTSFSGISSLSYVQPSTLKATIVLDDSNIEREIDVDIIKRISATSGNNIIYLKIQHCVNELSNLKINLWMGYVKLILEQHPNLVGFIIACTGKNETRSQKSPGSHNVDNATYENCLNYTFPKLEKLESLVVQFDDFPDMKFVRIFTTNLINSYSMQIKQLRIECNDTWNLMGFALPNLAKLTISQCLFRNMELECLNLDTVSIINYGANFCHNDIVILEALSPKLTCLEIKFECANQEFQDYIGETSPKLPNVSTLVLVNCDALTFKALHCFPNIRYLKLISEPIHKSVCNYPDDAVLHIKKLFQGTNLYKSERFWGNFPNILMATLEFSRQLKGTFSPKLYTFTRERYTRYNLLSESICHSSNNL